jgi:hypothetical protein
MDPERAQTGEQLPGTATAVIRALLYRSREALRETGELLPRSILFLLGSLAIALLLRSDQGQELLAINAEANHSW